MHVRQCDLEVVRYPAVLFFSRDLELDRQRPVCPVLVLTNESVCLEPAGKSSLGHAHDLFLTRLRQGVFELMSSGGDERALSDPCPVRVQVHSHPWRELIDTQPNGFRASLVNRLDDVIWRGLDELTVLQCYPIDGLAAVVLDGDDLRQALGVVDLAADVSALDEFADPDHSLGRRYKPAIGNTRTTLRPLLEADVEPDRRVEGGVLVDEDRLQLGLERFGLPVAREVAARAAPAADRVDDAADHVLHARLALGRAHPAAEVLLRDDVRRRLRPELRELDALLIEDRGVFPGNEGIAELPLHLLERVAARNREVALDADRSSAVDYGVHDLIDGWCGIYGCLRGRHASSQE